MIVKIILRDLEKEPDKEKAPFSSVHTIQTNNFTHTPLRENGKDIGNKFIFHDNTVGHCPYEIDTLDSCCDVYIENDLGKTIEKM